MEEKRVIWTSEIDLEDWKQEFEERGVELDSEDRKYRLAAEINNDYFEDERMNLDKILPEKIICIADLGLWDGRRNGWKILNDNLNSVMQGFGCDDIEIYADRWNVKPTGYHHDGRNYYTFRMFRPGITEYEIESFCLKLYEGEATKRDISRYTVSILPYVAEIYGWKIDGRLKKPKKEERLAA